MSESSDPTRPSLAGRVRGRVLSGLIVFVPLVVTFLVVRFILGFMAGLMLPLFGGAFADWPLLLREALAAVVLVAILYLLGEITAMVLGRKLLALGEAVLMRVPLVKVIYGASKQVMDAFQTTSQSQFRSVVAVDFPHPNLRSIGFVTGTVERPEGEPLTAVFVPTTPNPTTGFLQFVPTSRAQGLGMSVEEAIKTIMSLGVLAPADLGARMSGVPPAAAIETETPTEPAGP